MGLYLKITVGLLLLVQAFQLASLQNSTDSPGRTIDRSWLRELAKKLTGSQNAAVSEDVGEDDQGPESMFSGNTNSDGIASGSMVVHSEEEENVADREQNRSDSSLQLTDATAPPTFPTTLQTLLPKATITPNTTATTVPGNLSSIDETEAEEGLPSETTTASQIPTTTTASQIPMTTTASQIPTTTTASQIPTTTTASQIPTTTTASQIPTTTTASQIPVTTSQTPTTHLSEQNSTSFPENSNRTDLQTTTSAPVSNATPEPTTTPDNVPRTINATESTNAPTATPTTPDNVPRTINATESTNATTATPTMEGGANTTTAAPITPDWANRTDEDADSGSSSERGLSDDFPNPTKRKGAWGAILGIGVAVTLIGLVAYVILNKKYRKGFSHSKLVEEYPSDPVLRLDNGTPLDLNFGSGGSAYYNPGLQQRDNIQMDNIPGRP